MNEEQLKALLEKYKDKNFVKRMLMKNPPTLGNSTHSFEWGEADGKYYVYPTVVEKNGKLVRLSSDEAWDYANKNNELIPFDDPKQAEEFSKHELPAYKQYFEGKNMAEPATYTREQLNADRAAAQALKATNPTAYAQALKDITNKVMSAGKATFDANDYLPILDELRQVDPEYLQYAQTQALQNKQAGRLGQASQGLDILLNGIQMATGLKQIATAKNAASQVLPPSLPGVPGRDPYLNQALTDTRLGTINQADVLRPAQAGIQDAYRASLNQAQVASGGQAGAYQGMANLANLQRMRANLGLAPMAQQAKAQNQQLYNQLLSERLGETQNQFANRSANAGMAFDQYNMDANAVGALGSAGRTNAFTAGQRLTSNLQGLAPYFVGQGQTPVQPFTLEQVQGRIGNYPSSQQIPTPAANVGAFRGTGYGTNGMEYFNNPVPPPVGFPAQSGTPPVPGSAPVRLSSTLPSNQFTDPLERSFIDKANEENFIRRTQGANTKTIATNNPYLIYS